MGSHPRWWTSSGEFSRLRRTRYNPSHRASSAPRIVETLALEPCAVGACAIGRSLGAMLGSFCDDDAHSAPDGDRRARRDDSAPVNGTLRAETRGRCKDRARACASARASGEARNIRGILEVMIGGDAQTAVQFPGSPGVSPTSVYGRQRGRNSIEDRCQTLPNRLPLIRYGCL
jgi:hypothetical protein